jgi:hypothetical protein
MFATPDNEGRAAALASARRRLLRVALGEKCATRLDARPARRLRSERRRSDEEQREGD